MNLEDYWQENKRFVTGVAGGVVVFLIALLVIDARYDDDLASARRTKARLQMELREARFGPGDRRTAEEDNEALREAVDRLAEVVGFRARGAFVPRGDVDPSASYLQALAEVRDELLPRASRANLRVGDDLGMPSLSPTRPGEIARTLEALDVVETVLGLAIQAGVRRVDGIQVRLDPRLRRGAVDGTERTRVTFEMSGLSLPLARLLSLVTRPPDGRTLVVEEVQMVAARGKPGEASLELSVLAVRLQEASS